MIVMDIGRVCKMVRGKNAGQYCVIVDKPEKSRVLIDGEDVKRKEVAISHLEPLPVVLKIKRRANTDSILKALAKADLPG